MRKKGLLQQERDGSRCRQRSEAMVLCPVADAIESGHRCGPVLGVLSRSDPWSSIQEKSRALLPQDHPLVAEYRGALPGEEFRDGRLSGFRRPGKDKPLLAQDQPRSVQQQSAVARDTGEQADFNERIEKVHGAPADLTAF